MKKKIKLPLAIQIFIALVLGIIAGILLQGHTDIADDYIKPFGTIFLNLLKFIVVPIVLFSIMSGIISMRDVKKVGSIGIKAVVYYFCTTAIAIIIGLVGGNIFKKFFPILETSNLQFTETKTTTFMDTIVGIFPDNFFSPLVEANMLQVIVMAVIIGFAVILVGEKAKPAIKGIETLNAIFMKAMEMILSLSPIGVFCLITPVVADNGAAIIGSLAIVLICAYVCYIIHMAVVYSTAVGTLGGMNPLKFFKMHLPAMIFAFSSSSSVGTLPVNREGCLKMGADEDITSFVLPLGATINMDGTAIHQGVCAIFIATCYGVDLDLNAMLTIVFTAILASIGTAGVPGASMVMLAMVLTSVGLPLEGIALVAGVDRVFDMGRTVVNITGDASCTIVVSNLERKKAAKKQALEKQQIDE